MSPIKLVQLSDCGQIEGDLNKLPSLALYLEVTTVCGSLEGQVLWEKIRDRYQLGVSDCLQWVINMNTAINLWNNSTPINCEQIKALYGV